MQHSFTRSHNTLIAVAMIVASLFFLSPDTSHAITQFRIQGNVSVIASPENPVPNDFVTFKVNEYTLDYENAIYQWTLDGQVLKKGLGQKTVTFVTGPAGKMMRLSLELIMPNGELVQKDFTLNPAGASILWETESYTPGYFDGKPLPTEGSTVHFIAVPEMYEANGRKLAPSELYFEWSHNYDPDSSNSGYGKDTYSYSFLNTLKEDYFSVKIRNLDGSITAETETSLKATDPEMLFYEDNPLRGVIFSRALGDTITMPSKEFTIRAVPYFLPLDPVRKIFTGVFDWEIDGNSTDSDASDTSALTLRQDKPGTGSAELSCKALTDTGDVTGQIMVNFSLGGASVTF